MAKVAFIGLGNMGAGMAHRLLQAGHDLTVYNRTRTKAETLAEHGARIAATPKEAAAGAEAIFAMVSDDQVSRAVWLGSEGVFAAELVPQALAIECSTLSHDWVEELSATAARSGLRYIDCPVTGLPDAAAVGTLTLLVGAAPENLDAARDLLAPLSAEIVHFGPVGAGTAYKLMINLMGAVQIAAAAEGMAIAERAGLDLDQVARTIASGQAASPQVVRNTRRMADEHHHREISFTGRLRLKDASYGLGLAQKLGLGAPFGQAAVAAFGQLVERDLAELNESKIIEIARRDESSR